MGPSRWAVIPFSHGFIPNGLPRLPISVTVGLHPELACPKGKESPVAYECVGGGHSSMSLMYLAICMITHNRLEWTRQTLLQLKGTITVPHRIVVVDNASDDGTREWLAKQDGANRIDWLILNEENRYPGAACNQGWEALMTHFPDEGFTHFMRTDNDMEYDYGWDLHAGAAFAAWPQLGQLGLMNRMQHHPPEKHQELIQQSAMMQDGIAIQIRGIGNVGGTCILDGPLVENDLRWVEHDWKGESQECPVMSQEVRRRGMIVGALCPNVVRHMALGNYQEYEEYHEETFRRRGGVMWKRYQERLQAEKDGRYDGTQRIS